jgi:hypothetical protein
MKKYLHLLEGMGDSVNWFFHQDRTKKWDYFHSEHLPRFWFWGFYFVNYRPQQIKLEITKKCYGFTLVILLSLSITSSLFIFFLNSISLS